jgi:hypothetical protein
MPKSADSYLTSAMASETAYNTNLPSSSLSLSTDGLKFHEDITHGAIARAGALPSNHEDGWLKLANDKLKKENYLDYHSVLWEIGSEILENRQLESGFNETLEFGIFDSLKSWLTSKGGKISFVKPVVNTSNMHLEATEFIDSNEILLSMPMSLIMCQQTARNVVIYKRGRYLGEELQKTFEKDELWGLTIFLLHEYYKEVNGEGSKWGPFVRTLRMRVLTTQNLQVSHLEKHPVTSCR